MAGVRGCRPSYVVRSLETWGLWLDDKSKIVNRLFKILLHFIRKAFTAFFKSVTTLRTALMCSPGDLDWITISFLYTEANFHLLAASMTPIVGFIMLRAFLIPTGLRINQFIPWFDITLLSSRFYLSIVTCQRPVLASRIEKTTALPKESSHSFIHGIGYESIFVSTFSIL